MKNVRASLFLALIITTLALSTTLPVSSAAESKPTLTKKELKVLLKTAETPSEHLQIANYYRQEAQQFSAKVKYHEEMGAQYAKNPIPNESKFPANTFGAGHCRKFVAEYKAKAKHAEDLAAQHEEMARAAEQGK